MVANVSTLNFKQGSLSDAGAGQANLSGLRQINYHDTTHTPVALWNFDGNLDDSSGNSITLGVGPGGTERYAPIGGGKRGFFFDQGTYLTTVSSSPAALEIVGDMTIEMLIAPASLDHGGYASIIRYTKPTSGRVNSTHNNLYTLYTVTDGGANYLAYYAEKDGGPTGISHLDASSVLPAYSQIFHFAMVRASNEVSFYVDGAQLGSTSSGLAAPNGGSASELYVGSTSTPDKYFNGVIASLKICNTALTADQILDEAHLVGVA